MKSKLKNKKVKLKLITNKKSVVDKLQTQSTKNKRNQIYENGYCDGYSSGYMDGFDKGKEEGRRQILKHLSSFIDAFFEDEDF